MLQLGIGEMPCRFRRLSRPSQFLQGAWKRQFLAERIPCPARGDIGGRIVLPIVMQAAHRGADVDQTRGFSHFRRRRDRRTPRPADRRGRPCANTSATPDRKGCTSPALDPRARGPARDSRPARANRNRRRGQSTARIGFRLPVLHAATAFSGRPQPASRPPASRCRAPVMIRGPKLWPMRLTRTPGRNSASHWARYQASTSLQAAFRRSVGAVAAELAVGRPGPDHVAERSVGLGADGLVRAPSRLHRFVGVVTVAMNKDYGRHRGIVAGVKRFGVGRRPLRLAVCGKRGTVPICAKHPLGRSGK